MSAVAPTPPSGPVQGPSRGAGDPQAAAIIGQMLELAHAFIAADADPQDKDMMGQIVDHLSMLSQQESTESAPGPQHAPQGLGGPFQAALQSRGMMGGGQ